MSRSAFSHQQYLQSECPRNQLQALATERSPHAVTQVLLFATGSGIAPIKALIESDAFEVCLLRVLDRQCVHALTTALPYIRMSKLQSLSGLDGFARNVHASPACEVSPVLWIPAGVISESCEALLWHPVRGTDAFQR